MPDIEITNVPPDVQAVMLGRAEAAGQSLSEFLLALILKEVGRPTLAEVLDRAGSRTGGSIPSRDAAELVRAERDSRSC
jgi:hypothetical protein